MRGVKTGKNIDINARRHTVMTNAGKHDKCCIDVQGGPKRKPSSPIYLLICRIETRRRRHIFRHILAYEERSTRIVNILFII